MTYKQVGVIIQARMGSTRLPGKVLKTLSDNETVLDLLIKRVKLSKLTDTIIIATTPDKRNALIIDVAKSYEISYYIGSEDNVLERYYKAAKEAKLDLIIRITSDCPFIDPDIIDNMVQFYKENNYDYIKNIDKNSNFPRGLDIEVFSFKVLEEIFSLAKTRQEKEHVTYYIYTHPEKYSIGIYNIDKLQKFENLRLTIDEEKDLEMCREVYKTLIKQGKSHDFSIFDIINIIKKNQDLMKINKDIKQKKV